MATPRDGAARIAERLRDEPPELDDFARARIERRLVEQLGQSRGVERVRVGGRWLGALAACSAAVVASVAFWQWGASAPPHVAMREQRTAAEPAELRAEFETLGAASAVRRGAFIGGETVDTRAGEQVRVAFGESRIQVDSATEVRFDEVSRRAFRMTLARGAVDVAFHPAERGRESMRIETDNARVEVVGTVFRVEVGADRSTTVSVSEGTVRVSPRLAAAQLVRAGSSLSIGGDGRLVSTEPARLADPAVEPAGVTPVAPPEPPPTTEARLEGAREALLGGDLARGRSLALGVARDRAAPVELRAEAWNTLADALARSGEPQAAIDAYTHAIEVGGRREAGRMALYQRGYLRETRLRMPAEARADYERYLAAFPDGVHARQARARLCALGQRERCVEESE